MLRDAEGPRGTLSAVAFAGTIIFATGPAIDATITFTLAETADGAGAERALQQRLLPFAVGLQVFMLATAISVVRHGVLPKWMGWIAMAIRLGNRVRATAARRGDSHQPRSTWRM